MKSLDRTLRLLDLFTVAHPQWSLTELSQAADIPLSTVHRIASTLQERGLLARDPQSREFRLGFGAIALGYRALAGMDIPRMAKPIMRRLAQETRETVLLTVLNDARDCSICVERIDSQYDLRIHLEVGRQVPLHAGASAKVLLACLPSDEIDGFLQQVGLPKVAPNTITDPDILKEDLAAIRRRGYAVSQEETNAGAWGLAVPILDRQGYPVAALGVSAPVSRYSREAEQRFAELTRAATEEIAAITGSGTQTCS